MAKNIVIPEGMSIEVIQPEKRKDKRKKRNEQILRDLWGIIKYISICMMVVPRRRVKEN